MSHPVAHETWANYLRNTVLSNLSYLCLHFSLFFSEKCFLKSTFYWTNHLNLILKVEFHSSFSNVRNKPFREREFAMHRRSPVQTALFTLHFVSQAVWDLLRLKLAWLFYTYIDSTIRPLLHFRFVFFYLNKEQLKSIIISPEGWICLIILRQMYKDILVLF